MKYIIKILIICLCLNVSLVFVCYGYSDTGHEDFMKITLNNNRELLSQMTHDTTELFKLKVRWKLFGWSNFYINNDADCTYDGAILFSRSNKTNQVIEIGYSLRDVKIITTSVKVQGGISAKVSGKVKTINLDMSGQLDLSRVKENKVETTKDEKVEFRIKIHPNSKIIILTTGDGIVNTAASKYYFFGIPFKSGVWERVERKTTIFEIREEFYEE